MLCVGFSLLAHLFLEKLCMCQGGGISLHCVVVKMKMQPTVNKHDLL